MLASWETDQQRTQKIIFWSDTAMKWGRTHFQMPKMKLATAEHNTQNFPSNYQCNTKSELNICYMWSNLKFTWQMGGSWVPVLLHPRYFLQEESVICKIVFVPFDGFFGWLLFWGGGDGGLGFFCFALLVGFFHIFFCPHLYVKNPLEQSQIWIMVAKAF